MVFFAQRNNRLSRSLTSSLTKNSAVKQRRVHFTDVAPEMNTYAAICTSSGDYDTELEPIYWYSRAELKTFNDVRFDDAATLRAERHIKTASQHDADGLSASRRDIFVGDKITNALDDIDDDHEISLRGIEHFVFPVLQKEMVRRKKELKKAVIGYSRDPVARRKDPKGEKLAEESAAHSQWARDVATERGIKYCQMKRGTGRGGGLLKMTKDTKLSKGRRRFSALKD